MKKLIFVLILFGLTSCNYYYQVIKESPCYTIGTVVDTRYGNGTSFIYTFKVGNKFYKKNSLTTVYGSAYQFIGKKFLVVYNCNNPNFSLLLVKPDDYLKWDLVYPDSLKWVFYYIYSFSSHRKFEEWKIEYLQSPYL